MTRDKALDTLAEALDKMMDMYDYDCPTKRINEYANVRIMRICDKINELESMIRSDV